MSVSVETEAALRRTYDRLKATYKTAIVTARKYEWTVVQCVERGTEFDRRVRSQTSDTAEQRELFMQMTVAVIKADKVRFKEKVSTVFKMVMMSWEIDQKLQASAVTVWKACCKAAQPLAQRVAGVQKMVEERLAAKAAAADEQTTQAHQLSLQREEQQSAAAAELAQLEREAWQLAAKDAAAMRRAASQLPQQPSGWERAAEEKALRAVEGSRVATDQARLGATVHELAPAKRAGQEARWMIVAEEKAIAAIKRAEAQRKNATSR